MLAEIHHYVYSGDTAVHIAAAARQRELAESLVTKGADARARNRRGAEPLHYSADGSPGAQQWVGGAQRDVIMYLIEVGADPNALDISGVAPLHRAVRSTSKSSSGSDAAKDEQGRIIVFLLGHGTSPADADAAGKTVASAASSVWIRDLLGTH